MPLGSLSGVSKIKDILEARMKQRRTYSNILLLTILIENPLRVPTSFISGISNSESIFFTYRTESFLLIPDRIFSLEFFKKFFRKDGTQISDI